MWTGSEMIIWGGVDNTGGRYNPATNTWRATSTTNAPSARTEHTAVWTGTEMIVWGGIWLHRRLEHRWKIQSQHEQLDTYEYHECAAMRRLFHTAIWTGSEMIVWGGTNFGSSLTVAADMIPARTVGRLPASVMRLMAARRTPPSGPALR